MLISVLGYLCKRKYCVKGKNKLFIKIDNLIGILHCKLIHIL